MFVTVEDIRAIYKVTAALVYTAASRNHWRRIRHQGRTYYDLDDVHDTLSRGRELTPPVAECKNS